VLHRLGRRHASSLPRHLAATAATRRDGPEHTDPSYLRIDMAQLRRKLEPEPSRPEHLVTEPGMGYRFQP
jgi:DNA-binding response OmpR family regulator